MTTRAPTRFQPDPRRGGQAARFRFLLGKRGLPSDAQLAQFGDLLMRGDPLDELLAGWAEDVTFATARAALDRALDHGIEAVADAPAFLRELFAQLDAEPIWLDRELLELGQRTTCRTGPLGSLVMRDAALMGGYGNAAINKPLVFTGALAGSAGRRTAETRAFAVDVTRPGALSRFGKGFRTAIRVRFLHAVLRRRIQRHPDWRTADWGVPINQADMLATNVAFSVAYVTGMRVLGVRYTARERASVIDLWRYIGYLMGIDERILVTSEREGYRVLYTTLMSQPDPDDDTRSLALALMNEPYEAAGPSALARLRAEAHVRVHNGVSHFFLGADAYRSLGLPSGRRWSWVPLAIFPVTSALETVRQLTPFGDQLFVALGTAWRDHWIEAHLGKSPAAYGPARTLARDDKVRSAASRDATPPGVTVAGE